jgi:hypothetical protein
VANFSMHKSFNTNSMVLRRTRELHAISIQLELHKFFCTKMMAKKCSSRIKKESLIFSSINLLLELFCKLFRVEGQGLCWKKTTSDSMKVT